MKDKVDHQIITAMSKPLENYLRTYRKRAGLSQMEVAYLLGAQSGSKVSRYERLARRPTLETAFAFEIIFGATGADLFAGVHAEVEHEVKKRARRLKRKLLKRSGHRRKIAVIGAILESSDEEIKYVPME